MTIGFVSLSCACGLLISSVFSSSAQSTSAPPAETRRTVALAGNGFITKVAPDGNERITRRGLERWSSPEAVASVYIRVEKPGQLTVSLRARVPSGTSTIRVSVNETPLTVELKSTGFQLVPVGSFPITDPGYVRVTLQGIRKTGDSFGEVSDLVISGSATTSGVVFANDSANYYWSRRGPSVHLNYASPKETSVEWFYNELIVPPGEDKIGSYYMANGFTGGYFGIQVNSPAERRVLFSVWDPETGKTSLVRKGKNVTDNGFDGEGTGGQSYLRYNWKAGTTYQFLTQAHPDGAGNTLFSAWFYAPELARWQFMATWKRPNTVTYLTGLYSFLENFIDTLGYTERKACYNNQWIRSATGTWTELTTATFTGDATARNKQRMDYAGGVENGRFFLRNGGFFAHPVSLKTPLSRPQTGRKPTVDLNTLPTE